MSMELIKRIGIRMVTLWYLDIFLINGRISTYETMVLLKSTIKLNNKYTIKIYETLLDCQSQMVGDIGIILINVFKMY